MKCAQCAELHDWADGDSIIVNGEEIEFCSKWCKQDYMSENDLSK